jgi:ABC-type dipeptide/oligopeptide/nickel transport system permease subunit
LLLTIGLVAPWLATADPYRVAYAGETWSPLLTPHARVILRDADGRPRPARTLATVYWPEQVGLDAWYAPVPYSPLSSDHKLKPPGWVPPIAGLSLAEAGRFRHWLGTDYLGRDILSWLIHGARQSLWVALIAALLAWVVGASVGLLSGFVGDDGLRLRRGYLFAMGIGVALAWFYGVRVWAVPYGQPAGSKWVVVGIALGATILGLAHVGGRWLTRRQPIRVVPVDLMINRVIEVLDSLPGLLFILALASLTQSREPATLLLLMALVGWPKVARIVRAELLREKRIDYVEAARALGLSPWRVLTRHLLPNVLPPFLFAIAFTAGSFLIAESTLAFLGLVDESVSWGGLLKNAGIHPEAWWVLFPPVLLISLTVISLHAIGQWWQDRLDPRSMAGGDASVPFAKDHAEGPLPSGGSREDLP